MEYLAITSSANYLFLSSVPLNISSHRFELIVSGLEQVQQHIPYPLTSQMIDTFKSELINDLTQRQRVKF